MFVLILIQRYLRFLFFQNVNFYEWVDLIIKNGESKIDKE